LKIQQKENAMKAKYIVILFVAVFTFNLMGILTISAAAAETYKLDPDHTSIVFRVKHLSVANVYGRFSGATGSFVFDEKSPAKNSIEIQVGAETVNTAVDKRDKHLRSPDFFDVTKYPLISFKSRPVLSQSKPLPK
jgi:polyisoprenoid-binding protein YceI